jgi:hypothetical protein
MTLNASEAIVGEVYSTSSGISVEVIEKRTQAVIVKSLETGNSVTLPLSYQLIPVIKNMEVVTMSETNQPTGSAGLAVEAKPKAGKLKKSNVVDEGLRTGLSVDDIVKNVLAAFPETPEKSVRNLVSVRRSKLNKKTA